MKTFVVPTLVFPTRLTERSYEPRERSTDVPLRATDSHRQVERRLTEEPDTSGLFPHQVAGIEWLRDNTHALCADDMGLGKSAQALRALDRGDRAIVVCPATLKLNWLEQVKGPLAPPAPPNGWRPDMNARIARDGSELVPAKNEVVIINFEILPDPVYPGKDGYIRGDLSDVTVIVDEAHYAKNPDALRTQRLRRLIAQVRRAWLNTGTPMLNNPMDLLGVLETGQLFKQSFGTFDHFKKVFGAKKRIIRNKFCGWEFRNTDHKAAAECLASVMLRRTKAEVLPNLPKKVYTNIPVEFGGSEIVDAAEGEWQLYGATTLPPFEKMSAALAELARAKIPAMIETVARFEDEETPLLVFSAHVEPLRALERREGWGVLTGETPKPQRQKLVNSFQAGKLRGLGLSITVGGMGLTLTRAAHELFVDMAYTPGLNNQAEDRAVRIGQEAQSIQILRLVADHPLDRRLQQILATKQALIEGVVG